MGIEQILARGTRYAPFKESGLPESVAKRLNIQMTTAKKAQASTTVAKAITGYMSMREMVATEREMKAANIPIERTRHGKIIPIATHTGKILAVQGDILSGAAKAARETTINLADESAHGAIMDLKVAGLMEDIAELKENPTIVYMDPPGIGGFDLNLPDWLKLPDFGGKLAAVGAGVGVAIIVIIGIIAFAARRK